MSHDTTYPTAARNSLMAAHYPEQLEAERAARPRIPTKAEMLARIDAAERFCSVIAAITDLESVEDEHTLNLEFTDRQDKSPVAFAHDLPTAVVLTGLRAMRDELLEQQP
jgi:hypothetical protein